MEILEVHPTLFTKSRPEFIKEKGLTDDRDELLEMDNSCICIYSN